MIRDSVKCRPKVFQLFHPIGGVNASSSPILIIICCLSFPNRLVAVSVAVYSPASVTFPLMIPVSEFKDKPFGRSSAFHAIGRSPDVGI